MVKSNKHSFWLTPLLLLFLSYNDGFSQNCNCDHLITQPGIYRPAALGSGPFYLDVQPGDTICIQSGAYSEMRFFDFEGNSSNPVIVKNCGGQVEFSNANYTGGLIFENCRFIHLTGTGDGRIEYGFSINGTGSGASGLVVTRFSSDFEIDHVEVASAGFAGMMIKTDPNCDPASWRSNFTMKNVRVHHNYIHHTGGEGIYIGNSFWNNGLTVNCGGTPKIVYPHNITGLVVHDNLIENTAADGLQYACAPDAEVYNNVIINAGLNPFAAGQNSGIQCGGGSGGRCFNNIIRNAGGSGIIAAGHLGGNSFFNNLIVNSGGYGFFANDAGGSVNNSSFSILNNTIVNSKSEAIKLYNQNNIITIRNNAIILAGNNQYISFGQGATAISSHNFTASNYLSAGFEDFEDFRPSLSSPLLNAGFNVQDAGVAFDLDNLPRPVNANFDIGAYEHQTVLPVELEDFKIHSADSKKRTLYWKTGTSYPVSGFEIQRSEDEQQFRGVGYLDAGDYTANNDYLFEDDTPLDSSCYYRLKITAKDGSNKYSPVLLYDSRTASPLHVIAAGDQLILKTSKDMHDVKIKIFDTGGKLLAAFTSQLEEGEITSYDLGYLPAGIYIARVRENKNLIVRKFRIF